jgi:hypothetical protein
MTNSPPSVSRLSRENLGASTSHNPVTGVALPLPGLGPVAGSHEPDNAPLGAMNGGEYID